MSLNVTCLCPASQIQTVTLIPGDGIGPEISTAVMKIFEAAEVSSREAEHLLLKNMSFKNGKMKSNAVN